MSAAVLCVCLALVLVIIAIKWPFTSDATIASLERVSASQVELAHFQKLFFPHPGYIAQNVRFKRTSDSNGRPIATIEKITCRNSWLELLTFTHRIDRMVLQGVHVYIPAHVPAPLHRHPDEEIKTTVTELVANGTVLEVAPRHEGGETLRFEFPQLIVREVARNKPVHFQSDMTIPNPPGHLKVSGVVGPFRTRAIDETKVSGDFRLNNADLSRYKVIGGNLSADGAFNGVLARVRVIGRAQISNFEVVSSRHSLGMSVEYQTLVNGTNGDVDVQSAQAHFLRTTLRVQGEIAGQHGKTASLAFNADRARVEDLLRLFVTADRPPFEGPIGLRARVVLPPTDRPFIRRVQLDGEFRIKDGEFTNPATQHKVDALSTAASGKDMKREGLQHVVEDLSGEVKLRDGVANISSAFFTVPGGSAKGKGTYDLNTKGIDLRGTLAMHARLSKTVTGVKKVLLVPLDPLFKKNGAGAVVPVKITGTYEHPRFKLSFMP